jgi:MFS family permease
MASPAATVYPWLVVLMLWWISFFNYADRQALYSVFDLLRQDPGFAGITDVQLGWLIWSFGAVYGLTAPFAGIVVDRVRRKTAILGGLHAWSLICMATALARNFPQLLLFRAAEGVGETFYYPASTALISDYHRPATRSRALGIHQTSVYVGTVAGGSLAGVLGARFGWYWSFIVFGGLGILLGIVLQRWLREPLRGASEAPAGLPGDEPARPGLPIAATLRCVLSTPTVPALMLAFIGANFVAMVLLAWIPDYVRRHFQMGLGLAGLTATGYAQLASLVGAIVGGWLADRWRRAGPAGRILVQLAGVLGAAPFVVLCGTTDVLGWFIVALTGWGLFKGLYDANIFAAVFDVVRPEARGSVAGLMNMCAWLFGGAAGPVVGALGEHIGLGRTIASAAGVYVLAGVCLAVAAAVFVAADAARAVAGHPGTGAAGPGTKGKSTS